MNKPVAQSDVKDARRPAPPPQTVSDPAAKPDSPRLDEPLKPKSDARQPRSEKSAPAGVSKKPERVQPHSKRFWTTARIAMAGLGAVVLVAVGSFYLLKPSEPKTSYTVAKAAYGTVTLSVRTSGALAPRDAFDVATETGGQVQSMAVKSGDRVVKGQVLATLESPPLRDELLRSQTALASATADAKQADSETSAARAAVAHLPASASAQERDIAQARVSRAVAEADKLRVDVRSAELRVAAVRSQIAKLDVRAPASGIVLKRNVEPGTRPRVAQGQGLFTLISGLSPLNVTIDLPESELGSVRAGQTAEFTAPAFPGRTFSAAVSAIDLVPKKEGTDTGVKITYPGTLIADNPQGLLRPGMTASVVIIVARATNVLVVPNGAFTFAPPKTIASKYPPPQQQTADGKRIARIWVMKDDAVEPRDIAPGLSDGQITEVAAGTLKPGEAVVTGAVVSVRGETAG